MGVMTASHAIIPSGRPLTVADLEGMPDARLLDGLRP